jgi:hypothetical protein
MAAIPAISCFKISGIEGRHGNKTNKSLFDEKVVV